MKLFLFSIALLLASMGAVADINSVTVPATMTHLPNAATGTGYSGKVEYSLTPGTFDSVFVTLSITPAAGGAALELSEVKGDVGEVLVNVNTPTVAKTYAIFFQATAPQPDVNYIAHITATAVVSNLQADINAKVTALSSATKANLCGLISKFESAKATGATPIPPIYMNDGPYGWNSGWGNYADHATCFPACVNQACTWDTALARLQGRAKAEEWRAKGRNCTLGPGMTLIYHPLCGRSAEYMSEDPYLSGHIAAADAIGCQDNGVMATIKHFACNSVELNRQSGENSVTVSERTMQEIFLYNWKPAAKVAWGVMGSYNKVNGEQACSNKYLLTDVLRSQWGYRSFVMSDWGAVYTSANALNYGIDMGTNWQAPFDDGYVSPMSGASPALIDMHVGRIIYAHEKLGDMASGYTATAFAGSVENAAHKALVRTIGMNSIVLAKNTGNILPMPKSGKTIAILSGNNTNFGAFATVCQPGIAGSGNVYPAVTVSYVQGITTLLTGVGAGASTIIQTPSADQLNTADYILAFVGVSGETESKDRSSVALGAAEGETVVGQALAATGGASKTIVIYSGGNSSISGTWSTAPAIVIAHFPGDQQGASLADILFGNFNPCAKLSATFAASNIQLPPYEVNSTLTYPGSDSTHGYFRANKLGQTPLFAFGHGLSYTTFAYTNLQVFPTSISAGDRVHVRVTVQNLGTNPAGTPDTASEIVQLYLSMPANNAAFPVRVQDLRGFRKVTLAKSASATIDFELTADEMQIFNPNGSNYPNVLAYNGKGIWQVLSGTYGVRVGTSSQIAMQPTVSGSFAVK